MRKGIIFALIAGVISGVSIFYNRVVVISGIDSLIFNILKNGGVTIIFSFFVLFTPLQQQLERLSLRSWIKLITIGIIGGSIPFVLFFEGLKLIPAVQANLIHKTLFLWVALLAVPLLKERLSSLQIIAYFFIAWGTFFIGGMPRFTGNIGELMVLSATVLWSFENVLAKKAMKEIPSSVVSWARMTFGVVILVLIATFQQKVGTIFTVPPSFLIPIMGSVILLSGYVYFWYRALSYAPATLVTSLLVISTPVTAVLSSGILSQPLSIQTIISSALLGISVLFLTFFQKQRT